MRFFIRASVILLVAGCTNLDNLPLEPQIGMNPSGEDLSGFATQVANIPLTHSDLVVAEVIATSNVPAGDRLFLHDGRVFGVEVVQGPDPFRLATGVWVIETATAGAEVDRTLYELAFFGESEGHISDVTADGQGRLWFAITKEMASRLYVVDPVAGTVVRQINGPTPARFPWADNGVMLAYDAGKIYAGYDSTVVEIDAATGAPGRDLSAPLMDAFGTREGSSATDLAASDGYLIARYAHGDSDGVLVDLATGLSAGRVAGLPEGDFAGDSTSFAGVSSSGAVVRFVLSPVVPQLTVDQAVSFPLNNVRAITGAGGLLWGFFSPGNGPHLVGYDPATFAPVSVVRFNATEGTKLVNRTFNNLWPYTMATVGSDFYIVSATNSPSESYFMQVDPQTAQVVSRIVVPSPVVAGLCTSGSTLWATKSDAREYFLADWYRPSAFEMNIMTGASIGPGTPAPFESRDTSALLCLGGRVYISTDSTRLFASASTPTMPEQRLAAPLPTASSDTAVVGGYVFLLDRERQVVIRTLPPP